MAAINNIAQDINDLIYEHISNEYAWGNLGGIKVMIMKVNGYINAPKMATEAYEYEKSKLNDKQDITITKKKFNDWSRLRSVQRTITVFSGVTGIPVGGMMVEVGQHDKLDISGTYIHPDLAIKFADWLSDYFGYYTSQIVRNHLAKEERDKHAAEKRALEDKNKELVKDNMTLTERLEAFRLEMNRRHDEYMNVVNESKVELKEVKVELKEVNTKLDETNAELRDINNTLITVKEVSNTVNERLEVVEETLDNVKANIVPVSQRNSVMEMFVLLKHTEYDPDTQYQYYTVCGQVKYVRNTRAGLVNKDKMEEVLCIEYTPNTKNILHRIKDELNDNLSYRGNKIDLIDMTEAEFIAAINKINDEKFKVCEV